jgi:hypothetical protein
MYVMIVSIPDANQRFREITFDIITKKVETDVRPRVFFEDFPDTVLYVRNATGAGAGWEGVLAADTRNKANPELFIAAKGRMLVDRQAKTIQMFLEDGTRHRTSATDPTFYEVLRFDTTIVNLNPESVFPHTGPTPGDREMTVAQLRERITMMAAQGVSTHNPIMEIHKKFSIPVACFVFALVGLALGVSNRRDGKLASFVIGVGVIFSYYVLLWLGQSLVRGHLVPPWFAAWMPNIALGGLGLLLGTVGLATVMFRNVLERRRELALLRAVGYNARHVRLMILAETAFLLAAGLTAGAGCALIAIAPAWLDRGTLPGTGLVLLLAGVILAGLASAVAATRAALSGELLQALRAE